MTIKYPDKLPKFLDYYLVLIGTCIVLFWAMFVLKITMFRTEIYFHIFSEILMALLCIVAGLIKSRDGSYLLKIAAHSMLIYSTMNAAGFYAEKNDNWMLILFVFLFMISLSFLTYLLFSKINLKSHA